MSIYRVPTRLIPDLWSGLLPLVARACEHHSYLEPPDVLSMLLAGQSRLFLVIDDEGIMGFAAMEVVEYPRRKVATVMCLSGVRGFLSVVYPELFNELVRWAKEQGADTFTVYGRPGWLRVLRKENGAQTPMIAWSMRLGNVEEGRRQTNISVGAMGSGPAVPH